MNSELYLNCIIEKLGELKQKCVPAINAAALKVVDTVHAGHCVYFFGCTHAGILTQEAFYRTGGLAIINPIFSPGLTVDNIPITITSQMERLEGYGEVIAQQSTLQKGDLLFIHSVSGRNHVPVDLAMAAADLGVYVIGITSMEYSKASSSRHPSGKRLFEVCDMVIDNVCPFGDSLVQLERSKVSVAPGSTVLGATILNAIVAQAAGYFDERGEMPPVYLSANIDHGEDYNKKVFEAYKNQIKYLMI